LLIGMLLDQQVPMEWAFTGRPRCNSVSVTSTHDIAALDEGLRGGLLRQAGGAPLPRLDGPSAARVHR
jgi:hypothetical protein